MNQKCFQCRIISKTTEARWWCSSQKKIHHPALCFSYLYTVTHRVGESMYFYLIFIPSKFVPLRMNVPNIYQPEKNPTCFIQQGLVLLSAEPKWGLYSLSPWAPTELPLQGDQQFWFRWDLVEMHGLTIWSQDGGWDYASQTHPGGVHAAGVWTARWAARDRAQALTGTRSVWCLKHLPPVRVLLSENRETEDN